MSAIYLLKSVPETVLDVSALLSLKRREIKSFLLFFLPCVSPFLPVCLQSMINLC